MCPKLRVNRPNIDRSFLKIPNIDTLKHIHLYIWQQHKRATEIVLTPQITRVRKWVNIKKKIKNKDYNTVTATIANVHKYMAEYWSGGNSQGMLKYLCDILQIQWQPEYHKMKNTYQHLSAIKHKTKVTFSASTLYMCISQCVFVCVNLQHLYKQTLWWLKDV